MPDTNSPTLSEAVESVIQTALNQINTCLPGEIRKYDFKTQKADVKPLIKRVFVDDTVQELPVITNVPVVFPRSKSGGLTFPLVAGDGCLILFSQRPIERWASTGIDSEPGDTRKFDLSDAVCIPGLYSFAATNIASNNSDLEITHKNQKITLKANGDIELGTANTLKLVNENFQALFNTHLHVSAAPASVTGPPVDVSLLPQLITSNELTNKTKAE